MPSSTSSSSSTTVTSIRGTASLWFKPKRASKSPAPAAPYLSVLSEAVEASTRDAATTISTASTPVLSMSSSVSASTVDTFWTQADIDNSHGLTFPVNPQHLNRASVPSTLNSVTVQTRTIDVFLRIPQEQFLRVTTIKNLRIISCSRPTLLTS
ncbi:hypothetical protein D9757_000879 [Collybiopsis confluens]|uniref:Uncharacterized protein n=1 Tax=Collybiopsis confluens TaxID=2823264 RepID=A0A8H5I0N7_9AGAR|nr:hypothetical protein D9757_000879 [Collybiopsis confluens]